MSIPNGSIDIIGSDLHLWVSERITVTVSPDQVESANAFLATLDPAMDGTFSETLLTVSAVLPLALVEQIAAHFPGALRGEAGRLAALE